MAESKPPARSLDRASIVDDNFVRTIEGRARGHTGAAACQSPVKPRDGDEPLHPNSPLTARDALEILESQMIARHQDLEARKMRARNEGFYTIGSAGHEGNAVLGRLTRHTDMAFLHYRSGAFMAERARHVPRVDSVRDTMLSIAASAEDPIAGGRHKVWGSAPLWTPPQTSTIASHLPKSVGAAFFLRRASLLGTMPALPEDSIVICSFGDASVNHAAAQTAFNAAAWTAHQGLPLPILFVCEDNGIGISVPTPAGWIEASMRARPGIRYLQAEGLDIENTYVVATEAVRHCRDRRAPVFLHLRVVRLLGHAGTDAESGYRTWEQIEATEARDPLLRTAGLVIDAGLRTPEQVLALYDAVRARVQRAAQEAAQTARLQTADEIIAPLAPWRREKVEAAARWGGECWLQGADRTPGTEQENRRTGEQATQYSAPTPQTPNTHRPMPNAHPVPRHMAALINEGLHALLTQYPEAVLFGEDVAKKGGVYFVTAGLEAKFGVGRVFNTLLDETMILGLAIGAGHMGLLPIPEIQYLAYYHNAEDQIRGEACSLQFFSNGQFRNPMVVRIQGWSYQKGFGGHFHNDNSIAALRDVPGLIVATPARGDDAVNLLRTLTAHARVDGRVCVLIEPIALYMTRDLYEPGDGLWQFTYPEPGEAIPFGEGRIYHPEARDLTILTFANGLYLSLRAARTLVEQHGIAARVADLRWLNPLNEEFIVEQATATGRVLVMDESRKTGGIAEAILAILYERTGGSVRATRLNALDTYVPLGPAADLVLPTERDIVAAAVELVAPTPAATA